MKTPFSFLVAVLCLIQTGIALADEPKLTIDGWAKEVHGFMPWVSEADLKDCMTTYLTNKTKDRFIAGSGDVIFKCRAIKLYSSTHLELDTLEDRGEKAYAIAFWQNEFSQPSIVFGGTEQQHFDAISTVEERNQFGSVTAEQITAGLEQFIADSASDLDGWKKKYDADIAQYRKDNPNYRDLTTEVVIGELDASVQLAKASLQAIAHPTAADLIGGIHSLRVVVQLPD